MEGRNGLPFPLESPRLSKASGVNLTVISRRDEHIKNIAA
jgi:hypothetical protein